MAKGGRKAKDSKKVAKGTQCFMKFNSNGSAYRVCKSAKELKDESARAAKNKKKAKTLEEKRKQLKKLEDNILKAKRDLKKVEKEIKKKSKKK
jgi:septal ring factor EnvC (AmiA/AmiB activator)